MDQTLENFYKDVSDRFRRRLPDDMNQVQRRRARSTSAIMKELRYGIFPSIKRFKACYLAVLRLKIRGFGIMIRIKHRSVSSGLLLAATSQVHQSFHEEP